MDNTKKLKRHANPALKDEVCACPPDQVIQAREKLFPEIQHLNRNQMKRVKAQFLNEAAVDHLQKLIDRVSETATVIIVLTSTWRRSWDMTQPIREMFQEGKFSECLIDRTPDFQYKERAAEIRHWLREKGKEHNVQKFVILDDDAEIVLGPQMVRVDKDELLQHEDVERALAVFSAPPPDLENLSVF
jgi:hypothetical protein